jgi:NAD(P)-dependent dehydrogenase (short-subunit alcohol dehydrogenase family)
MAGTHTEFGGKVAVVTGGTQGLGEAIARLFAERGAAGIVICGRNAENGRTVAAGLTKAGCRTEYVQADLADLDQTRAVMAAADRVFGRVDTLVNAGRHHRPRHRVRHFAELFERMMAVNLRAPFFLMQDAAKIMRREKIAGTIVNISRCRRLAASPFLTPYSVSKGALRDADQERGVRPDAVAHSRQRAQSRLDGNPGRGSRHAALSWAPGRLARERRCRSSRSGG